MRNCAMVRQNETAAHDHPVDIATALANARLVVEARLKQREAQGDDADEEEQTHWLCDAAWPHIRYAPFNRREEGVVGADWLWWFLDDSGECFGVLIQAKKLSGQPGHPRLDLAYPRGTRSQMRKLFAAADDFDVPSAYILFCGDRDRRADLACSAHEPFDCSRCTRLSVAVLPGLAAECAVLLAPENHPRQLTFYAYRHSIPLEDMVQPADDPVLDVNLRAATGPLRELLMQPQDGARAVAKRFFAVIADIRRGQFSASRAELLSRASEAIFSDLPADVGHFGRPYYDHVLRGLRRSLPEYVTDRVLHCQDPMPDGIDGLALVHL